ncbi:MAG: DUF1571 domain-containing protein [Isosphaeraceae bacterium]
MDSAHQTQIRCPWIWVGLLLCIADTGCARMSSFRPSAKQPAALAPPMLGAKSQTRSQSPSPQESYAQTLNRGRARSEALLAQNQKLETRTTEAPPGSYTKRILEAEVAARAAREAPGAFAPARAIPRPRIEITDLPPVAIDPLYLPPVAIDPLHLPVPGPSLAVTPEPAPASISSPNQAGEPPTREVRALIAAARAKLASLTTYQVQITRQERVGNTLQPVENIVLSARRDPKAIRIEWPDGPHKGREVLYSADDPTNMHVNMADAIVPLVMKLPLTSPRVRDSSRHPISEAGLDGLVDNLVKTVESAEAGGPNASRLSLSGPETPEGLDRPCHKITEVRPDGEIWVVDIDVETALPALVQANAPNGDLLERYSFRDVQADLPKLALADAFDPGRWKRTGAGLLERLARSTGSGTKPTATSAPR